MRCPIRIALLSAVVLLAEATAPAQQTFRSSSGQVVLLELFTSQGCSSCPPAEAWFSKLAEQEDLWSRIVPVAFHVDYWDELGWEDPFASQQYSRRQYAYRRAGRVGSIYTPGMVAGGRAWRGWRRGQGVPPGSGRPGRLEVRLLADMLQARFEGQTAGLDFHVVVLGCGLTTRVLRGENAGRTLRSDFVVLHHVRGEPGETGWRAAWPPANLPKAERYALAAWVSHRGDPAPVQALGGWLAPCALATPSLPSP
jgi:hypothetical protein